MNPICNKCGKFLTRFIDKGFHHCKERKEIMERIERTRLEVIKNK